MTKYFATYCVMDGDTGSNIFWHACLILSEQETPNDPVSVLDSVGFYSDLSTTTNPIIKALKNFFGCKFNLQDCHGFLKQEEMRYLDSNGLHGLSFEATKEQLDSLMALYKKNMALEQTAINELNTALTEQGEPANSFTRYVKEKANAAREARPSRLQPFHLSFSINRQGFDSTASTTCKTYALNLLLQCSIIDQPIHDAILGSSGAHALPRYSGIPILPLRLVSIGEPDIQESRKTKAVFYNRKWGKNSLFWASSLHVYEPTLFNVPSQAEREQHQRVKDILTRIQKTETRLRQKLRECDLQSEPSDDTIDLKDQLHRVQKLYDLFKISAENQLPQVLAEKLLRADRVLNVAEISLSPERIDHSFLMRVFSSLFNIGGVLSLIMLFMLSFYVDEPLNLIAVTGLSLFASFQMMKVAKDEATFAKMKDDYDFYLQSKPRFEPVSELDSEGSQAAFQ